MAQLRLGRRPDGTRDVRILEPASARKSGGLSSGWFSGTVLTGQLVQGESTRDRDLRMQRDAMKRVRAK